ncbi:hypothetical protein N7492_008068 [Penicillium capsulatum]|uniref:Protein kinase domain-containing protein n=1 Tax=Penicillium capsulatum TaxID=69766 RepID=A0A9W9HSC4_9EURO|nr:hypothetical protein N7492_008068 [Penicillium capsulatum]
MDLKPRNILIFEKADAEGKHIWKISDFGMSRVKTRREGQTSDRDFNTLFARRREPLKSSATVNLRGEGEFLAPESIAGKPTMNEKSDVWSLGCVASVVFVYLEEGATGVSLYQDERLEHPKSDGFDRFFLRNKGFALSKTHPVVTKWHARLIKKVSERGGTWEEEKALKEMLEFLEDSVLQEQPKRCDVGKLGEELHKTHSVYKTVESSAIRHTSRYRGLADKIASHGRLHKVPNHNTHQNTGCHIEKWLLGSKDSFKGCEISSDGTVAVFWTDKKISLFTSQSLSSDGNDVAQPADEFIISETNCVLKSIVLTDKCLVASTSGGKFQCYIFDLRRGPFVDATLNYHRPYALEHPEITKLAVAPGGHTMACVLRDRDKSHNAGWLLLAPTMSIEASPWIDKIDDPAADVIQLSFPTDDDIYIALRPCSTTRRREHQIRVIHFNIPTRMMDTLVIESQGLDSSNHVSFFTTFAHFQREPDKCAIVTRQKRLRITNLANNNTSPVIEAEIKTYRVLLLMMDPDDNKFYALGRHSASHAILVLEIKMPDQNTREVELRERAQISGLFYNDEFSARLCGTREGKYLLVTALMSANQRAIYKIHIGNPVRP